MFLLYLVDEDIECKSMIGTDFFNSWVEAMIQK